MIKSLEINNFRCFNSTKANNFVRINLLGGKNNAGKTAFLEALLLMTEPSNQSIGQLLRFRRVDLEFVKEIPKRAWDNFFYKQKKDKEISFVFEMKKKKKNRVTLHCDEVVDDFIRMVQNSKEDADKDMLEFANSLSNNKVAIKSSLHTIAYSNNDQLQTNVFVSSSNGIVGRGIPHKFIDSHLVPASFKLPSDELAKEFDVARLDSNSETLLKAFQIIDESIERVETYNIGKAELYLKRKGENPMPLSLFGDAMNKIADFILRIVNNKNSILLVDEIENGIHYENQEEIWKMIFDLCIEFQVQLFATTHSGEMIEAFKNIVLKFNLEEHGNYFEMSRHPISNEITIRIIPINSLDDKILKQDPIRGEKSNRRRRLL